MVQALIVGEPGVIMRIGAIAPQDIADICSFRLDPDHGTPPSFDFVPGQFLQVFSPSGEGSYFAIASAPGERYYDLLVKRANGCSKELFDLPIGAAVRVVGPLGKGFALAGYTGYDLLLIGVGTGIAPLRSIVGRVLSRPQEGGRVTMLYGVLTPQHWCYRTDFSTWQRRGIDARVTVTSAGDGSWSGPVGFVQELLSTLELFPSRTVACLVGMKDMIQSTTTILQSRGIPPERILLNF